MTQKRFVMYGNTVYEMKNDNKVELLPTDCFCLLNELNDENEQLKSENKKLNERVGILEGSLMEKGFDIND